jgi:phosphopantothenoylcysteine synthetase/decarboxylase
LILYRNVINAPIFQNFRRSPPSFMSSVPRVIVTCGPSYEPIDQVRRLTNFSTGELGMMLAVSLAKEGFHVTCFKGEGATTRIEPLGAEIIEFTTNDHLHSLLTGIPERNSIFAFLHTAALCDFKVAAIRTLDNQVIEGGKISSRAGELHLTLRPALKLISLLRSLFPSSLIVGWKYEVEGGGPEVIAKGLAQIVSNDIDACVVNGPAYGEGFGYLTELSEVSHLKDKQELCTLLARMLSYLAGTKKPNLL